VILAMKARRILIVLAALVFLFSGCSVPSSPSKNGDGNIVDLMAQFGNASWPDPPASLDSKFQKSLFNFSWELFLESSRNDDNILISPASVYLALGMAYNGADSTTKQAIAEALRAKGISIEEFNTSCRDYISILNTKGDKTELSIANAIWYRDGFRPDKDFLQKNADYFGAGAKALDFNSPKAVETINGWVREQTRNTIDKIIDQIDADVVMYLMNAVYFKSDWMEPFSASDTGKAFFYSDNGKVEAQFMNKTGSMNYIDKDGVKGIVLPYDNGRFNFFAIMPQEGTDIRKFIEELDGEKIFTYLMSIKTDRVQLALPKFETRFEDSLKDELTRMGMGVAFDSNSADFSLMNEDHEKNLFISEVKHKTYCRVDEKGTEAAAVTSIEMELTSALMPPEIRILFDRPFVYGIVDSVTQAPLFLGLMRNPTK